MNTTTTRRSFCYFCKSAVALTGATLVHHGFEVPGNGNRYGHCNGTNKVAIELSNEVITKYITAMESIINNAVKNNTPAYEVNAARVAIVQAKTDLKNWTPGTVMVETHETREAAKREFVQTRKASLIAKIEKHMGKYARLEKELARELKNLSTWVKPEVMDQMIAYTYKKNEEEVARAKREENTLRAKLEIMR